MAVSVFADPFGAMQQGRNVDSQIAARDSGTALNLLQMQQAAEEIARNKEYMRRTEAPPPPPNSPQAQTQNQSASDMIYSKIGEIDKKMGVAQSLGMNSKIDQLTKERDAMLSRYALAQQREESAKKRMQEQQKETVSEVSRFASSASTILSGDDAAGDKVEQLQALEDSLKSENPEAYKHLAPQGKIDWADPKTLNQMRGLATASITPEKRLELQLKAAKDKRDEARTEEQRRKDDAIIAHLREGDSHRDEPKLPVGMRWVDKDHTAMEQIPTKGSSVPKDVHGEEFLQQLPEDHQGTVKAIAEGRMDPRTLSTKGGHREAVMNEVTQYRPDYNQAKYSIYAAVQKDFTSGAAAKNVTAINTAIAHMGTLDSMAHALDTNDTKALNAIVNGVRNQTGDPRVNNFQIAAGALSSEMMRVFRQVGASETEQKDWEKRFAAIQSPQQMKEAVQTAAKLLRGRIDALDRQWKRGMDSKEGFPDLLDEKSRAVLTKIGVPIQDEDTKPKAASGTKSLDDYLKSKGF